MSTARAARVAGALLAACALSSFAAGPTPVGKSTSKTAAPDLEFLEYLGTLESDGENWTDVVNVNVQSRDAAGKSTVKGESKSDSKSDAAKDRPKADDANKSARNEK